MLNFAQLMARSSFGIGLGIGLVLAPFLCLREAQAALPAAPSVFAAAADDYDPYSDPSVYFAENAVEQVGQTLFGWYDSSVRWNLTLDSAPDIDGYATGTNEMDQPFTFNAAIWLEAPVDISESAPSTCFRGIWNAAIETSAGSVIAWGLSFRTPQDGTTIIPLFVPVDQTAAWDEYSFVLELNAGTRMSECALDETAQLQADQNAIDMHACIVKMPTQYLAASALCTAVGIASCILTFGAGCLAGLICDIALLASYIVWVAQFYIERGRANSCLCLETQWRADHPGQSLPSPSCGKFGCPDFVLLPLKL